MLPGRLTAPKHPVLDLEGREHLKLQAITLLPATDETVVTGQKSIGAQPCNLCEEARVSADDLRREQLGGTAASGVERPVLQQLRCK